MSSLSLPLPMLSTPASQSVNASLIACLKKSTVIIILHFYKAQAEYKSCRRMTVRGQRSDLSPKITTVITYCHQPYYVTSKKNSQNTFAYQQQSAFPTIGPLWMLLPCSAVFPIFPGSFWSFRFAPGKIQHQTAL